MKLEELEDARKDFLSFAEETRSGGEDVKRFVLLDLG
jgi:hypothetical protein